MSTSVQRKPTTTRAGLDPSTESVRIRFDFLVKSNNYSTMPTKEYRVSFAECRELLTSRLDQPAIGRIQLLTGPRQVGKTTLLLGRPQGYRRVHATPPILPASGPLRRGRAVRGRTRRLSSDVVERLSAHRTGWGRRAKVMGEDVA